MKKSTKKIITGIILWLLGGVILPFVIFVPVVLFILTEKPLLQFIIPAEIEVAIEKPGEYYVWNDHHTTFEGKTYANSEEVPGNLEISLIEKESENSIPFQSDRSISSQGGSAKKGSVGRFQVDKPGNYVLEISGQPSLPHVFSFGKSFLTFKTLVIIFVSGLSSMIMGVVGFVFMVVGIIQLCKEKKAPKPIISSTA